MKKVAFLTMIFILVMSSIALCAVPDPTSGLGNIQLGYNYYGLNKTSGGIDQGRAGFNELYGTVGIGLGYGGFLNYAKADKTSYTDFGFKTSLLIPNIALLFGQRQMETNGQAGDSSLFFGASFKQGLIAGISVYATYQKGFHFRDEVVGVTYDMGKHSQVSLSWKDYNDNNNNKFRGVGGGVNIRF